ncbi:SDR family NAD(P)-dependent oxidoreductase [Pseudorhodoplanes sp.]|uniref:SDR family NAD(P)-dependent oxidoreductase n=1 Tax=Pseudorhodoplanes sp. TaxID=1934341 RepID=UPI002CE6FCE2|nr:SDR family NAD(P)-dependent oxidoreductase [Pseudorhodoplanes sp.]HWV41220.1 SDR family NAD(P)-dependent oxidoreductase [Pseudorhodoplanes sp.]
MGEFSNKVVVVTGGSRGIGRGIAEAFAREGAQTVIAATSERNLAAAAEAIAATGGPKPVTAVLDLRKLEDCQKLHALVKKGLGRCDVLVNNAGATRAGNFLELTDELWQDGFALKFFGCVRLSRLFWPMLKEARGSVVNIGGGAARTPGAEFTIGASCNAAMANFSKALSRLGMKDDVTVNIIHPGLTETDRIQDLFAQRASAAGKTIDEIRVEAVARDGINRMATAADVAALAVFLCSAKGRHIQGAAIPVDGGATPGFY